MKVAFDSQIFLRQRNGGISRLFTDLIQMFDALPQVGVEAHTPFRYVNSSYAAGRLTARGIRRLPNFLPRELAYLPSWAWGLRVPQESQIVHHTYYDRRFLKPIGPRKRVCTVHDMIPEILKGTRQYTGSHLAKREYIWASDLIICVSESSKRDLVAHIGEPTAPVVVIPNAVSASFHPNKPALPGVPKDYLLYVGKRQGYKSFALLPEAVKLLSMERLEIPVVVVGSSFNKEEEAQLSSLGVRHLFYQRSLDDIGLQSAYAHCRVLVQTSSIEGFGMTPLEAMASGAPVVIADASAMPEVGGEVARYFDPGDSTSLAAAVSEVLLDGDLCRRLRRQGPKRAEIFNCSAMATRTAQAYELLLSNS